MLYVGDLVKIIKIGNPNFGELGRVTSKRFPEMKHLGDISRISGAEIEPVDVITFGSPCQDLSVAGQRKGLKHDGLGDEETTRSGLFMEAVRIIKEMRCKTNGKYPTFAVWENVPGAYSSNKGEDFRAVLEELAKVKEPDVSIPKPAKWSHAGGILGDGFSIAWRTLDAQYWGVPQRRRRIYLVADFGGERAGKILFEQESLRRDFETCGTEGQGTTGNAENSTHTADREDNTIITAELGIASRDGGHCYENIAGTLRANAGDNQLSVIYDMTHADEVIREVTGDKCPTLQARMGTGGNQVPVVLETPKTLKIGSGCEGGGKGALVQDNKSATLGCNNDQYLFQPVCYSVKNHPMEVGMSGNNQSVICPQGNGIDRADTAGCNGRGWNDKTCYTLNTIDRPAVCYGIGDGQPNQAGLSKEKAGCLNCMHDQQAVLIDQEPHYIVRRLTPLECCRLQGFPDWWTADLEINEPTEEDLEFWREVFETHRQIVTGAKKPKSDKQIIKWLKNPYSDSAEYKMWGNGVALPCVLYVMQGIADELQNVGEQES